MHVKQRANVSCHEDDPYWVAVKEVRGCHSLGATLCPIYLRWTPHPVIVAIRDNTDYIRVLLYSYYTTITGRGLLLIYTQSM